jgi:hypothetical protein
MAVTSQYSFRLIRNYTTPPDLQDAFAHAKSRISVIAGATTS